MFQVLVVLVARGVTIAIGPCLTHALPLRLLFSPPPLRVPHPCFLSSPLLLTNSTKRQRSRTLYLHRFLLNIHHQSSSTCHGQSLCSKSTTRGVVRSCEINLTRMTPLVRLANEKQNFIDNDDDQISRVKASLVPHRVLTDWI